MKDIIRHSLQKTCSPAELGCWFEPLKLEFDAADAQISVLFPHAFFGPWFDRQGRQHFERCAREAVKARYGREARFAYRHPPTAGPRPLDMLAGWSAPHAGEQTFSEPASINSLAAKAAESGIAASPTPCPPAKTETTSFSDGLEGLDNFIVNVKNAFPLAAAREVAEAALPPKYNPFVICGKSGTGKTHILRALSAALIHKHGQGAVFCGGADLFSDTLASQGPRNFARNHAALLVDDLQRVAHNRSLQEKIVRLLDYAHDGHKQMIFASASAPASTEGLVDGLRSRLEVGLVVELKEPDLEVRMRFAQMRCRQHSLKLEREHTLLLAQRCTQLRHLSGVILKMTAFHSLVQRDITAADLENILRSSGEEKQVSAEDIINTVALHLDVPAEDIVGSKRQPQCVRARQWAMYLCRELLGISYPALGKFFGGKDHSTVIHSIKKIGEIMVSNKDAQILAAELKHKCLAR